MGETVSISNYFALSPFEEEYLGKWLPCGSEGKEFTYDAGDPGSIPGSGRSPGGGNATHSNILAWRIPPTEEPGGLQSMGGQRVSHS